MARLATIGVPLALAAAACVSTEPSLDAGGRDAGSRDASVGTRDAGPPDAPADAWWPDAPRIDCVLDQKGCPPDLPLCCNCATGHDTGFMLCYPADVELGTWDHVYGNTCFIGSYGGECWERRPDGGASCARDAGLYVASDPSRCPAAQPYCCLGLCADHDMVGWSCVDPRDAGP